MELIQCGGSWWRHGLAGPCWRASRCRRVLEGRWRRWSCQSSMARVVGRSCGWCSEKEGWRSEGQEKERGGPRFLQRRQAGRGSHLPILSRPPYPPWIASSHGYPKVCRGAVAPKHSADLRLRGPSATGVPPDPCLSTYTEHSVHARLGRTAPGTLDRARTALSCLWPPGGATGRLTKTCDRRVSLWNSQARPSG